jgi:quercetin dioxygenase-like cupin family protein
LAIEPNNENWSLGKTSRNTCFLGGNTRSSSAAMIIIVDLNLLGNMIKYLQLPVEFDRLQLQQEASKVLTKEWALHYNTQQYQGNWEALPLRSVNGDAKNVLALDGSNHFEDTPFMALTPYIKEVVDSIHCPKMSIRLLNLKAGAIVHAHADQDLYFEEGEVRLHVPIVTNPLVEFYLEEERITMQEGECWYMNLALKHRLHNKSSTDRIHLVMDCKVNDWLIEQFNNTSINMKKEVDDFPKRNAGDQRNIIEQLRLLNTAASNKIADEMEAGLKQEN